MCYLLLAVVVEAAARMAKAVVAVLVAFCTKKHELLPRRATPLLSEPVAPEVTQQTMTTVGRVPKAQTQ
jgi:hypothetical protein